MVTSAFGAPWWGLNQGDVVHQHRVTSRWKLIVGLLLALSLVAAGCGGTDEGKGNGSDNTVEEDAGPPQYGGKAVYGIEADPGGGTSGFCIPEAQLAISGILIARTFYDTLTIPNADGGYSPWLAESVTGDDAKQTWTITLRDGVKFHDGTTLDSTVVKNNIDAWRGTYQGRSPILFRIVFDNIADVTAPDAKTVVVTTKKPWPAFPAYLWASGRLGIMAQAQLDSPDCATKLIGTGPFVFGEYIQSDRVTGKRNPDYWYKDPATGNQLPYLDDIEFKVVSEGQQRVNGLQSGDLTIMHTSGGDEITQLEQFKSSGTANILRSEAFGEVSYAMLNVGQPPFDNKNARLAVAYGIDRQDLIDKSENGVPKKANGPFSKGNVGYLEDTGFPEYNPEEAKKYLAAYKADTGKDLELNIGHTPDVGVTNLAKLVQEQAASLGVKVNLQPIEQGQLINTALGGNFQALLWRNHPGGDPDTQYVWWHSGYPTNFSKINDPEIDRLLDEGRVTVDEAARKTIYEDLNRRFASEVYNLWTWFTPWAIGFNPKMHNILGPDLPDGKKPSPGLATGHSLAGLWMSK